MNARKLSYTILNGEERPLTDAELNLVEWPEFMTHDAVEARYWRELQTRFPQYQFAVFANDDLVGYANNIPLSVNANRIEYNDRGWNWALEKGFADVLTRRKATVLCGLQIGINKRFKGRGLSTLFINGMKQLARECYLKAVILPLRPTLKHQYPLIGMEDYLTWQNDEGLPFDPWLRTHVKLGAEIKGICHSAMYVSGTIAEWKAWTGLSFQSSGHYIVAGALVPIKANLKKDLAEYTEPNIWVRHNV